MRSILSSFAARLRRDQRGATAVEYGIMVSLIAVVIIVAVTLLGGTLKDTFTQIQCSVSGGAFAASTPAGNATCTPKATP
ncbi:Flp family type IVb pilin [Arthrobacter sp. ok362]|uniref:Flp family type IVb pilin n=1 Tax=Arthrobacter sp. ok362 TaxID=1761745 RepID=UPI00088DE716|nr:Flp family type IVb pilin [Arthrobacter sp. ok362]SDL51095.1 pilus assembly protein Flp/PilA [Arthrobacter sp. ok362]